MAQIEMKLFARSAEDLRETLARLLGSVSVAVSVGPDAVAENNAAVKRAVAAMAEADKPKAAPKAKKADPAPASLPTVQEANEAAAATTAILSEGDGSSAGMGVGPLVAAGAGASTSSASSAGDQSVEAALSNTGETPQASYDDVKKALVELMDKKSASVVQGLLKEHFGVPAISQMDKARYGEAVVKLKEWASV